MKSVRVVASVAIRCGRILVTRRKEGGARGGLWEFPGGKVEGGETEPAALRREIREELGCAIAVGPLILRHRHRYPELEVELAFFACELAQGEEPACLGVAALEWTLPSELTKYSFCEADVAILDRITAWLASSEAGSREEG